MTYVTATGSDWSGVGGGGMGGIKVRGGGCRESLSLRCEQRGHSRVTQRGDKQSPGESDITRSGGEWRKGSALLRYRDWGKNERHWRRTDRH